jgi:hypothetical protein
MSYRYTIVSLGIFLSVALAAVAAGQTPDAAVTVRPNLIFAQVKADKTAKSDGQRAKKVDDDDDGEVDEESGRKRKCPPGQTVTTRRGRGASGGGCM